MRIIIPPLTSQYLNLTKNSSLAVAIGYPDLVAIGGTVLNQTGQAIEVVVIWMVVYLGISLLTSAVHELVQRQDGAGGEIEPCKNTISPSSAPKWRWRRPPPRERARASAAGCARTCSPRSAISILTILGLLLVVAMVLPPFLDWAFINAQWTGTDRTVCATVAQGGIQPDGWSGACWAFVNAKFGQFMFGRYPDRRALAVDPGRHAVRRAAGAAADPDGAVQGAERDPVLRRLPDRRVLPAGRRLCSACRMSRRRCGAACW